MRSNHDLSIDASWLWVAWSPHRRTTGLCAAWNIPLHVLRPSLGGPGRWLSLPLQTVGLLRQRRPQILFVPNPSLALAALAALCRPLFGYCLVVDAHNEGVRPFDRPYALVRWLTRCLLKAADVTIVTNDALAEDVRDAGGRPQTLPDSLPVVPDPASGTANEEPMVDVAVVATFRRDEPIDAIMAAAKSMPELRFAFTGPAERFQRGAEAMPANVSLTGFLDDPDYWRLLARARVVCDLTLKPDCLVCGAYEALALGKPMVLSDNPATRDLFGPAAVLTGDSPADIAAAVQTAIAGRDRLEAGARTLRESFPARWQQQAAAVRNAIRAQCTRGGRPAP